MKRAKPIIRAALALARLDEAMTATARALPGRPARALTYRSLNALRSAAEGFFTHALTRPDKHALSAALYDQAPWFEGDALFDWERRWFDAQLPTAPARLLIGGAGSGREALSLVERGYDVDLFDPVPAMVERARRRLEARGWAGRAFVSDYERLHERLEAARDDEALKYDAVLLGWGSFTHVLGPEHRRRTLLTLDGLCAHGPLLLSYWGRGHVGAPGLARGIAYEVGRWCGRMLGGEPHPEPGERYVTRIGFGVVLEQEELARHARVLGRSLDFTATAAQYAHATLMASYAEQEMEKG